MRLRIVAAIAVLLAPAFVSAWDNKRTHPDLVGASLSRLRADAEFSRTFAETYGLPDGLGSRFALKTGEFDFFSAVDADFESERFERTLGKAIDSDDRFPFSEHTGLSRKVTPDFTFDVERLLRTGAWVEDNPNNRAQHHFHDPSFLHDPPAGNRGLDDRNRYVPFVDRYLAEAGACLRGPEGAFNITSCILLHVPGVHELGLLLGAESQFDLRGRSARDRALNLALLGRPSEDPPRNIYSLADAERYLYRAFTAPTEEERLHAYGIHFLALGHVLHLLEDMASPAHTRNDFQTEHVLLTDLPTVKSFDTVGGLPELRAVITDIRSTDSPRASLPRAFLSKTGADPGFYAAEIPTFDPAGRELSAFWDDDSVPDAGGSGLAEVVQRNFFSLGSVSNNTSAFGYGYPEPVVETCANAVRLPLRRLDGTAFGTSPGVDQGLFVHSELVPHLGQCTLSVLAVLNALAGEPAPGDLALVDISTPSVQRDYIELLFALTLEYEEKFLRSYFAPRLAVLPTEPNRFKLANRTRLPIRARPDAIQIAYEGVDGQRHVVAASCDGAEELLLAGAPNEEDPGPPSDLTCALPASLSEAPASHDFWVVVRGALGERGLEGGEVGAPDEFEAGTHDFVVAFERVAPELLFSAVTDDVEVGEEQGRDLDLQWDMKTVGFEPTSDLPDDPNPNPSIDLYERRTDGLRRALDRLDVDFLFAVAEPGGRRIALRSDRDTSPTSAATSTIGAPRTCSCSILSRLLHPKRWSRSRTRGCRRDSRSCSVPSGPATARPCSSGRRVRPAGLGCAAGRLDRHHLRRPWSCRSSPRILASTRVRWLLGRWCPGARRASSSRTRTTRSPAKSSLWT